MGDEFVQLPVVALLAGALGLGYRRWIRPRRDGLSAGATGVLLLLVVATMAGFLGSPFWWFDVKQSFSWDLPPLASRMLAAAGAALTIGAVMALEQPRRARVRLNLILLATYVLPLTVAAFAFHLDRFDFSAPLTFGFFIAVFAILMPSIAFLVRQPEIPAEAALPDGPAASAERAWFAACAVTTGLWGVALFVTDDGPSELVWVWPGDLLSSRLVAVMLLTLAAGSLYSITSTDAGGVMLWVTAVYGALVPVANLWNLVADKPVKLAYVVVFALLALGSATLLATRASSSAAR